MHLQNNYIFTKHLHIYKPLNILHLQKPNNLTQKQKKISENEKQKKGTTMSEEGARHPDEELGYDEQRQTMNGVAVRMARFHVSNGELHT